MSQHGSVKSSRSKLTLNCFRRQSQQTEETRGGLAKKIGYVQRKINYKEELSARNLKILSKPASGDIIQYIHRICPVKTDIEPELLIQIKRIFFILDKAIDKMYLVTVFHLLLENDSELLREHLTDPEEFEFVLTVLQKNTRMSTISSGQGLNIFRSLDRISCYSLGAAVNSQDADLALQKEARFDPYVSQAIEILWNCRPINEFARNCDSNNRDEAAVDFIDCLIRLKTIMLERLTLSSEQEMARQKELKLAFRSNILLVEHIKGFQQMLQKQRDQVNGELEKKMAQIEYYEKRILELTDFFRDEVAKRVQESEKKMTEDTQNSELKQVDLSQEAKMVTQTYQSLLEEHLAEEKMMRAKRLKIEAQLASWVNKYDADMGERQTELEAIQKEFDDEKAEMDALQDLIDDQDDEYTILMAEKEEEEQRIFNEMAYEFLRHRSARRIQRFWRAYRERKLAKKKARKSKKKGGEGGKKSPTGKKAPKKEKKGGSKKGGKKEKKEKDKKIDIRSTDPNAALASAFKGDILEDIKVPDAFSKQD